MEGNKLKKMVYKTIERALLPITDAVICVSEFERNAAIENGLTKKNSALYITVFLSLM